MTIYFIEMEGSRAIKIGFTANDDVTRRMAQLQTGQPAKLGLVGSIHGDQEGERALHAIFAAYRTNGEWFEGPPIFREFIKYVIANELPWSYCRAYGVFDGLLGELASRAEAADFLRKSTADSVNPCDLGTWQEKQVHRYYRKYKEQRAIAEALTQANAELQKQPHQSSGGCGPL